ncbi:FAD-binding protein [Acuticoccus sp. MNP-M23]|uniref:FAD-binding protein n=1 Tax=Acuticoccus sp. MNP-M23 TaxID=3072793 RepID=UPI00281680FF|nr:FAD-binding protein [Acuticoccus sp. MNP-M23]WMS44975.1 FAD-binding protein [Acuticoccus sp. MNP-M23]
MSTFSPDTAQGVLDAVAFAANADEPLEVVGGGTKRAISNPSQVGHTLDVSGVRGIDSYEPDELVLTLAPGTPMAEVAQALEGASQMLAFEPPDYTALLGAAGTPTFGGTFGTNFAGPRRVVAGAVRDHMLGIAAVSGRGEAFKAGGRVVKNVTGYDLARALAGSWGTLAVVTQMTVKVLPKPERETTLVLPGHTIADAVAAMSRAMGSACDVSAAAHAPEDVAGSLPLDGDGPATLLRIDGFGPSVEARVAAAERLFSGKVGAKLEGDASAALWRLVRDGAPFAGTKGVIWRCSVAPTDAPAIAASAPPGARILYDWAGGLLLIETPAVDDGGAREIRNAVDSVGGHATLLRAPLDIRAGIPTFHPVAAGLAALSTRLRNAFDPKSILNPNRMAREQA